MYSSIGVYIHKHLLIELVDVDPVTANIKVDIDSSDIQILNAILDQAGGNFEAVIAVDGQQFNFLSTKVVLGVSHDFIIELVDLVAIANSSFFHNAVHALPTAANMDPQRLAAVVGKMEQNKVTVTVVVEVCTIPALEVRI